MDPFQLAAQQIGLNEGDQKAALSDYLNTGGQNLDPATTAWCAAFVNATLNQSGAQGTNKLNARSYLDWGTPVDEPQRGDVAVFSRGDPNGWQGHVGFFDGYNDDGTIRVLGGNQKDAVSIASYDANSLLGFRRGETSNALAGQPTPPNSGQVNALAGPGEPQQMPPRPQVQNLDPRDFMSRRGNALASYGFGAGQSPYL